MSSGVNENKVPISEKTILTVQECAALTGIGQNTLEAALNQPKCPFVLKVGRKKLIIRNAFDKYIEKYQELKTDYLEEGKSIFDLKPTCFENNDFRLFPDRGAHATGDVVALLGHIPMKNYGHMIIDDNKASFGVDGLPGDLPVYSAKDISYPVADSVFKRKYETAKDYVDTWNRPDYEKQFPMGAYVITDAPANNVIFAKPSRIGVEQKYVLHFIDANSRNIVNQPNMLILDASGGELATRFTKILTARGYDVKVIDVNDNHSNIGYNPLQLAIDFARKGDGTSTAMNVETIVDCVFDITADVISNQFSAYVLKMLVYGLIINALYEEKEYGKTHKIKDEDGNPIPITSDEGLSKIWSTVNLQTCFQVYTQVIAISSEVTEVDNPIIKSIRKISSDDVVDNLLSFVDAMIHIAETELDPDNQYKTLLTNAKNAFRCIDNEKMLNAELSNFQMMFMEYVNRPYNYIMSHSYENNLDVRGMTIGSERPTAIFLTTSPHGFASKATATIFSMIAKQLTHVYFDKSLNGSKESTRPMKYIITDAEYFDESHVDFSTELAIGLGVGVQFTIVTHSMKSLRSFYGEDFKAVHRLANIIYLGSVDQEVLDYMENRIHKIMDMTGENGLNGISYKDLNYIPQADAISITADDCIVWSRNETSIPKWWHFAKDMCDKDDDVKFGTFNTLYPVNGLPCDDIYSKSAVDRVIDYINSKE